MTRDAPILLRHKDFGDVPHILHGFCTRVGGVSEGVYASLNCGPGSGDKPDHVQENRRLALHGFGLPDAPLYTLSQVHGREVVTVTLDTPLTPRATGDALVTATPGHVLGILTADCAPVLFADRERRIIGAAHAGWKGAAGGVLEATLEAMRRLGARTETVEAVIGPCIGPRSYEVDSGFRARFLEEDSKHLRYFVPASRAGHFLFTLSGYITGRLERSGIRQIHHIEEDTLTQPDRFFSYRRATLRGEGDYGRLLAMVALDTPTD